MQWTRLTDRAARCPTAPPPILKGLSRCAPLLAACANVACAGIETEQPTEVTTSAASPHVAAVLASNGETLVFESINHTAPMDAAADEAPGEPGPVVVSETGSIDADIYQRYARPFAYAGDHHHHHFAAWQVPLDDGTVERGVRVTRTSGGPAVDRRVPPATWVDPSLLSAANDPANAAEFETVLIRIRDFPDWDIPLLPDAAMLDVQSYADALQARESAVAAREALFQSRASVLQTHVEAAGGTVTRGLWYVGWVEANVPLGALSSLAARSDVQTIASANMPWGTGAGRSDWRPVEYMGVQPYWDAGQVGDEPNPDRHAYGGITIGTIDTGPVKDEAAAFCTDFLCTSTKLAKRYRCDAQGFWYCAEVSNYPTSLENQNVEATNHATTVAAAAVADYKDGQGVLIGLPGADADGATSDASPPACASPGLRTSRTAPTAPEIPSTWWRSTARRSRSAGCARTCASRRSSCRRTEACGPRPSPMPRMRKKMRRIDPRSWRAVLASCLLLAPCACSSTVTGGGDGRGAGGAAGGSGGRGASGGAGGGEEGGAGGAGGEPFESELCGVDAHPLAPTCAAITDEESCVAVPWDGVTSCAWRTVELLPDMFTCQEGTLIQRCMAIVNGSTGACPYDCPAEGDTNAYYYCEREDGSVELLHYESQEGCITYTPPPGFTEGSMKDTDPEAYLCRCEL